METKKVCLVYGGKQGAHGPMQVGDYYRSTLYQFARVYASEFFDEWGVLSGINGLMYPNAPIPAHEYDLLAEGNAVIDGWAKQVAAMADSMYPGAEFTIVAPRRLMDAIEGHGLKFEAPFANMRPFEVIRWVSDRLVEQLEDEPDEDSAPAETPEEKPKKRGPGRPRKVAV
jgi:hypothetical protein